MSNIYRNTVCKPQSSSAYNVSRVRGGTTTKQWGICEEEVKHGSVGFCVPAAKKSMRESCSGVLLGREVPAVQVLGNGAVGFEVHPAELLPRPCVEYQQRHQFVEPLGPQEHWQHHAVILALSVRECKKILFKNLGGICLQKFVNV